MKISVVITAHNKEKYIGRCLSSIHVQQTPANVEVETIVVLKRCTDKTGEIAKVHGATVLTNDLKNFSAIKNTGVNYENSEWVVTIDADSWMTKGRLQ